jgi:hypothetical protein
VDVEADPIPDWLLLDGVLEGVDVLFTSPSTAVLGLDETSAIGTRGVFDLTSAGSAARVNVWRVFPQSESEFSFPATTRFDGFWTAYFSVFTDGAEAELTSLPVRGVFVGGAPVV